MQGSALSVRCVGIVRAFNAARAFLQCACPPHTPKSVCCGCVVSMAPWYTTISRFSGELLMIRVYCDDVAVAAAVAALLHHALLPDSRQPTGWRERELTSCRMGLGEQFVGEVGMVEVVVEDVTDAEAAVAGKERHQRMAEGKKVEWIRKCASILKV